MMNQPLSSIVELTETQLEDHIDEKVSKARIDGMLEKMKSTKENITHLEKVRDRWGIADTTIKITGALIAFLFTFITAVINVLPEDKINNSAVKIVTATFASLAAITTVSAEGTMISLTSRNKKKYNDRVKELEKKYDRCFLLFEKARSDNKITNGEIVQFYSVFEEKEIELKI